MADISEGSMTTVVGNKESPKGIRRIVVYSTAICALTVAVAAGVALLVVFHATPSTDRLFDDEPYGCACGSGRAPSPDTPATDGIPDRIVALFLSHWDAASPHGADPPTRASLADHVAFRMVATRRYPTALFTSVAWLLSRRLRNEVPLIVLARRHLQCVPMASGACGVAQAAAVAFDGKGIGELGLAQIAILFEWMRSPWFAPCREATLVDCIRRRVVSSIRNWRKSEMITEEECREALSTTADVRLGGSLHHLDLTADLTEGSCAPASDDDPLRSR